MARHLPKMTHPAPVLHIAEIPYPEGGIHYRYSRRPGPGGMGWVRHGLFQSLYPTGQLAQEGTYLDGRESGRWRSYHENGQLASEGEYREGREVGTWRFWNADGSVESVEAVSPHG